jgi:ketosteroid isomerase-like protein
MSEENIAAIRPVYEAWSKGDFTPQFDVYAPDMEWGYSPDWPDNAGMDVEIGGKSERLREFLSPWEDWRCEAVEYIDAGDRVVVFTRYTGKGKESGFEVDTPGAHVWTMRDGKATRLEVFPTREPALEAAGLGAEPSG